VKFLVVGLGGIGQRHVRNIRALLGSSAEIMAFRVRRESPTLTDNLAVEAGVDLEERYGLRVFDQLDVALAERPDAVLICNPTSLHVPVALEAARAGSAIFVEKPLSHRMDGTEELIRLTESKGLVGIVGYQLRFHPCLLRLRSLLDANAIGRVVGVRIEIGEYLPGWHTYEDYRQMYASRAGLGGGVVLSQIHELDYVYWLFGMPRRVFAVGGHLSRLEIDVEDTASLLLECVVDGRPIPVHVHQDYVQRPPTRTCEVIGDAGKIQVDLRANSITVFDEGGNVIEATVFASLERNQLFLDEMSHFLGCLAGQETPVVNLRDGRRSLEIALAAKRSMDTGHVVDLEAGGVR
jgi:predicted dehydrogenase